MLKQASIFIDLQSGDQLHLKRWYKNKGGIPIFCLHGSIENGKIFYSDKGKGLAPYLAENGFDIFIGDLRGRGLSKPSISKKSSFGQHEAIMEDIPAFLKQISIIKGEEIPIHTIAHSWGGVLMLSYLARHPKQYKIASQVYFGSKRQITVTNFPKLIQMDLAWNLIGNLSICLFGYINTKGFRMGADNESKHHFLQLNKWAKKNSKWIDIDGYDIGTAIKKVNLPPTLYFAAPKDPFLGNPIDVQILMKETRNQKNKYHLLSKENGHLMDYNHINMLTHPKAIKDHFPMVIDWIRQYD